MKQWGFYRKESCGRRYRTGADIFGQAPDLLPDKYSRCVILMLALLLAGLLTGWTAWKGEAAVRAQTQKHLAEEVLRFHVLANSDSEADQALKMTVKERVLAYLESEMPDTKNVKETKLWLRRHVDELEELSRKTVTEQGYDYPVTAAVTTCWFPDKTYGDVTFPAGNYEALRIEIGAAEGQNWWCVLYPELCFLDAANAVVPEEGKQSLRKVLTEEEYAQVTASTDFKIKWRILELLFEEE